MIVNATPDREARSAFMLALGMVAAVTAVRCAVLVLSPLDLYPDEAQYWWWAQTPDFGYFSKPPIIAWIIHTTTRLLGDSEWAVRIASPLLHAGTSLLVFGIARHVTNARLSLLGALAYLTLPGISYSCGLISTDVPLLFFWAAALFAFLRACEDGRWRWSFLCGASLGLGLESKYAMLYFLAGAVVAALLCGTARRLVFGRRGLAILAIGLVILAPNIVWNAVHGFPTVAHTEANADWARSRYSVGSAGNFMLGQFGVFGPLLMVGWIGALWRLVPASQRPQPDVLLAAFSVVPLLLILLQSFVAGANANWAATAFIAASPLSVAQLARWWRGRALLASFLVNGVAMLVLWIVLVWPGVADSLGVGNAFKREEGWRDLGREVTHTSSGGPYDFIAADNRSVVAELLYYARPRAQPIRIWARDFQVRDHFEMTLRLAPPAKRVLLTIEPPSAQRVLTTFDLAKLLKVVSIRVGGHRTRVIDLYDARDYRGAQVPHATTPVSPPRVL